MYSPFTPGVQKKAETFASAFEKVLAATYSRGSYTTTTIGNAAFHGRVRNGNGWSHCFMTTRKASFVEGSRPLLAHAASQPPRDHQRISKISRSLKTTHRMWLCSS